MAYGCYSPAVNAADGSVWCSDNGRDDNTLVRLELGDNPPESCIAEVYMPPPTIVNPPPYGSGGLHLTRDGIVWQDWRGSGHFASFDRSVCTVTNGPTATGQSCPEGWTFHRMEKPTFSNAEMPINSDESYLTQIDHHDVLGFGPETPVYGVVNTDSLEVFVPSTGEFVTLRIPYPMGFFSRSSVGRIDDPDDRLEGQGPLVELLELRRVAPRGRPRHAAESDQVPGAAAPAGEVGARIRGRERCAILNVVLLMTVVAGRIARAHRRGSAGGRVGAAGAGRHGMGGAADVRRPSPNLQGVWLSNTATPLQRPPAFADRDRLTEEEVATLAERADRIFRNGRSAFTTPEGAFFAAVNDVETYEAQSTSSSIGMVDLEFTDRTSLIVDPPDGRLPALTPDAQAREAEVDRGWDEKTGPEDLNNIHRCITTGVPRLGGNFGAGPYTFYQIVQTPDVFALVSEAFHDARLVPLDGRPHVTERIRQWNGDARGRWDGDTLVIETRNFSPGSYYRGAADGLHLVERLTRTGSDTITYRMTFTDSDHLGIAVDGRDSAEAARSADLRVRLPRGQLLHRRDAQDGPPRRRRRGGWTLTTCAVERGIQGPCERKCLGACAAESNAVEFRGASSWGGGGWGRTRSLRRVWRR